MKEVAVAQFKELSRNLSGGADEYHGQSQLK
jgi:hypothetical protein